MADLHGLNSNDDLTITIVESGVVSWEDLIRTVQQFHYGRNQNRVDLELVWSERKGTCSSKHAFLKMIADLNNISGIELILCIYKMRGSNTSGVGKILTENKIDYIPEAHCYLRTKLGPMDITNVQSNINRIEDDILESQIISVNQVDSFKVNYHKEYIRRWAKQYSSKSFAEVWDIREKCIEALEK